jgi:hypothetical protein
MKVISLMRPKRRQPLTEEDRRWMRIGAQIGEAIQNRRSHERGPDAKPMPTRGQGQRVIPLLLDYPRLRAGCAVPVLFLLFTASACTKRL